MKSEHLHRAHCYAQEASNDLLVAYGIMTEGNRLSRTYFDCAITHTKKLANILGYDLVKREEKQEAA